MDYDEDRIYYSYQNLQADKPDDDDRRPNNTNDDGGDIDADAVNLSAVKRHFTQFLRNYRQRQRYLYRDRLLRMHQRTSGDDNANADANTINNNNNTNDSNTNTKGSGSGRAKAINNKACIHVELAHLGEYDTALLALIQSQPAHVMPAFEAAAADALKSLLKQQQNNTVEDDDDNDNGVDNENGDAAQDENGENTNANTRNKNSKEETFHGSTVQIFLRGNTGSTPLRKIQSHHLNTLVHCTGIVISASRVRSRATTIQLRCSRCDNTTTVHATGGPFGSILLPQRCMGGTPDECGLVPYSVVPDDCAFVDQQTLKLQESPEVVPTGEMPRSVLLAVERGLVDRAPPGTRVNLMAIVSLFNSGGGRGGSASVKTVYLRVLGMQRDSGTGDQVTFTPREEEAFRALARRSDVYDILSRSMAPSISGSYTHDIKKAMVCQLFSGLSKKITDEMRMRGKINELLLVIFPWPRVNVWGSAARLMESVAKD
mmetsp:Transcript_13691/g.20384  ORF Transcript_13691/g.20384 Transcript_13691/m.20384 type:complete len:487 (-) Transcript_13691:8-1468(-)